jgi:hypothetical protein
MMKKNVGLEQTFFKNTIYEKFSLKKDLILKGIRYTLQSVHCEKVASAINKKLV